MIELELLGEHGYTEFILRVTKQEEHCIELELYEVESWDSYNTPDKTSLYLSLSIKWDGCSHLRFGEPENIGYIHLCGANAWKKHCAAMEWVYKEATRLGNFKESVWE